MHAGVGADVLLSPTWHRALLIVALERGSVILPLIAEQRTEIVQPARLRNQTIPIIVSSFVPQVAEQSAIRLAQLFANALARGIVGLFDVDRDNAIGMAR